VPKEKGTYLAERGKYATSKGHHLRRTAEGETMEGEGGGLTRRSFNSLVRKKTTTREKKEGERREREDRGGMP